MNIIYDNHIPTELQVSQSKNKAHDHYDALQTDGRTS